MTQRDKKNLLVVVLSLVGVGIGFYALNAAFLAPISKHNRKIDEINGKIDQTQDQIFLVHKGKENLKKAQERSLPVNQVSASSDYFGYLTTLLDRCGLKDVNLKPEDIKASPSQNMAPNAAKKPGHTIMTVTINAKGTLAAVVKAMDEMQRTPLQHRIKSFTIGHQENSAKGALKDNLNLTMTMEAMIVAGTDPKKEPNLTVNTSLPLPTAEKPRRYADLAKKNIFIGPVPENTFIPKDTGDGSEFDIIDPTKEYVGDFMRLVHTDPTNQEAYLRQLLFKDRDTRVRSNDKGFDTFQIVAEMGETVVKAQVLRIDQRDMYIQVRDFVYAVHIGRTVSEGMRNIVPDAELKRLDLLKLVKDFDPKKEAAALKAGKNTKKKGQ